MFAQRLAQVTWECVHFVKPEEKLPRQDELAESGIWLAELDGRTVETQEQLFVEIAGAMQFPDYFGHNWNALDECLRDMEWLPARGYVLYFHGAANVWGSAPYIAGGLVKCWLAAGEEWARDQVSFHLVFVL